MSEEELWWRKSIGADICKNCAIQLVNNKLCEDYADDSFIPCTWRSINKTSPSMPAFFSKISSRLSRKKADDENDDDLNKNRNYNRKRTDKRNRNR